MIEHKEILKNNQDKVISDSVISGELFGDDNISVSLYFWNQIIMNGNKPSYQLRFGIDNQKWLFTPISVERNFLIYLKNMNGLELLQDYSDKLIKKTSTEKFKTTTFYVPISKLQNNQISLSISTIFKSKTQTSSGSVSIKNKMKFLIKLNKNPEKQKNLLTLKNYFTALRINLENKENKKMPIDFLDIVIDYEPKYFANRLDFDLKINYKYQKNNEKSVIVPHEITDTVDNIFNKLNTPDDLIVSDVILHNEKDYKIKKIEDSITEDDDSFLVQTITKTHYDSKIGAVTDYQFGDQGIVKNFVGKEKVIFTRYVSFNGINFNVDSSGKENNFNYEIKHPNKMILDDFFEYEVNYLKNDWNNIWNLETDINKGLDFIDDHRHEVI